MENKVIYVPVSVQEELPEASQDVFAYNETDEWESQCFISPDDGKWYNTWAHDNCECMPSHWLKRIELPSEEDIKEKAESNFPINDKMSWEVREYVEWQRLQLQAGAKYILSIINQKK